MILKKILLLIEVIGISDNPVSYTHLGLVCQTCAVVSSAHCNSIVSVQQCRNFLTFHISDVEQTDARLSSWHRSVHIDKVHIPDSIVKSFNQFSLVKLYGLDAHLFNKSGAVSQPDDARRVDRAGLITCLLYTSSEEEEQNQDRKQCSPQ